MTARSTDTTRFWTIVGIICFCAFLYFLAPVIIPFVLGAIFAYILTPFVGRMESIGVPRTVSVIIIFIIGLVLLVLLIGIFVPMLTRQVALLVGKIPLVILWAQQKFNLQIDPEYFKKNVVQHLQIGGAVAHRFWTVALGSTRVVIEVGAALVIIPVVALYLLRDWRKVTKNFIDILPVSKRDNIVRMIRDCGEVLSAFFRGQLLVMIALAIIYSIGLTIIGLDLSLVIGVVAGVLSVVPYLGFIIGFAISVADIIVKYHSWAYFFYVCIVFAVGHVAESYILQPWLVGNRIGLHPVAVIFAVVAGGVLFGFVGVLLALPVAAVIKVLLMHLHRRYVKTDYYTHVNEINE